VRADNQQEKSVDTTQLLGKRSTFWSG